MTPPCFRPAHPVLFWTLVALVLGAGIGLRAPAPPDEPRFVLAAQQMIDSGHWLLPHRGSELYAEKPPLFMWLQALAIKASGGWRGAFLLPSLLAALATLWLSGDLAARLWGRRFRMPAILALLCCLQFGLMAKRAQIDMLLVSFTTLSLWALARCLLLQGNARLLWLAGIAAGLGTVTKGVGFLPLLAVLPWAVWQLAQRSRQGVNPVALLWLLPAFVLGTLAWLAPLGWALWHTPTPELQGYARELLFKQTGTRYAHAWHHVQPAWYYLQVMATLWLPAAALLPWLLPAWWRRLRRGDGRSWLLLGWALLVLLFFSLSPGKREVYLLPILPALAVAAAPLLPALCARTGVRALLLAWSALMAICLMLLGVLALQAHPLLAPPLLQRDIPLELLPRLGNGLFWAGAALAVVCLLARTRHAIATVLASMTVIWLLYGLLLMPALDRYSSASALMQAVGRHIGPSAQLALLGWREQNLLQADRTVTEFGFKRAWPAQWHDAAAWLAQAPQQRWLLVLDKAQDRCVDPARVITIGSANRNRWLLVPGSALRPGCVAGTTRRDKAGSTSNEQSDSIC
jgi:4-amino-4-deoxy-L-arabinose transferase-like glycosyltransferase